MSNTKDTGFLRNLISYDASGNITLPANLTVTGSLLANGGGSYATQSYVTTQITNLINSAPTALDTLNELAAALGNDANFSTTVTNSIASKLALTGGTLTGNLNGTTIRLSSDIQATDYRFSGTGYISYDVNNTGTESLVIRKYGTSVLTFNSIGAATFSSSIYLINGNTRISSDGNGEVGLNYGTTTTSTYTFSLYNNTTRTVGFTSAGAGVFNSSLTVGGSFNTAYPIYSSSITPLTLTYGGNTDTYTQTTIYVNQNNTSGDNANGIFIERGRLSNSGSAEVRQFIIGARGGDIQWRLDANGNSYQTGSITSNANISANRYLAPGLSIGYWDAATNRIEGASRPMLITSYGYDIGMGFDGGNSTLFLKYSNGSVGIGTTSFSDLGFGAPILKVYGSRATLGLTSTGSLSTIAMIAGADTSKAIHLNQENTGALRIYQYSAAGETFTLLPNGNVGLSVINPTNRLQVSGNIYSSDTVYGRNLQPFAFAGPAAGSTPTSAGIPMGYSSMNISSPCDNQWRALMNNLNDTKAYFWVTLGDAASKDTANYFMSMTSPAYGVSNFGAVSYQDNGWNTGGFEFTTDTGGSGTYRLLVRCTSYYNSANTAYGTIYFLRLE